KRRAWRGIPGRVAEVIVKPELGEMDARIDGDAGKAEAAQIVPVTRQVDIFVFELGAPVAADGKLDARAGSPARLRKSDSCATAVIDEDVSMPPGEAAGDIRHDAIEGIADAAAHGADIVDRAVERDRRHPSEGGMIEIAGEG